jgi:hypothetical protein
VQVQVHEKIFVLITLLKNYLFGGPNGWVLMSRWVEIKSIQIKCQRVQSIIAS